jgi:peptidoglycan/LPS O-acetylase OafA/YrhL
LTAILTENVARQFLHPFPLVANLLLSLAVAAILHHAIENPGRRLLGPRVKMSAAPALGKSKGAAI